ncbi:MAG: hypothetical protein KJ646_03180 [Nanoarchaeota archaeon]|nr:hypothetical protein [Nanoarchaeota archaeon]MBU4117070.1 hypothetical protein [Nanoarchaeota archaeon]
MCDKYNIRIGLEQGLNKLLFGNEEIPFDENFIKLCKDNNKDCEKYKEINIADGGVLGYCIK